MEKNKNKSNKKLDLSTFLSVVTCLLLLLGLCLMAFSGLIDTAVPWFPVLVFALLLALTIAMAFRTRIKKLIEPVQKQYRTVILILVPLAALFLIEQPYSLSIFGIEPRYFIINLSILIVLFCFVYYLGQRTKTATITFLIVCFLVGLTNFFVLSFKGQPILPSDLFALKTAAAVGSDYRYYISSSVISSYFVLAIMMMGVTFLDKPVHNQQLALKNISIALASFVVFGAWAAVVDIGSAYGVKIESWNAHNSYSKQGFTLSFTKRVQDSHPKAPYNYSRIAMEEILAPYESDKEEQIIEDPPHVLVIMNESFSDLSQFKILSKNYQGPEFFNSISDAVQKGSVYVSAFGGGTCNSEFEFFTGCSLGIIGSDIYPYIVYDLKGVDNLVSYFKGFGYETLAIHPEAKTNWRRNIVYEQFGFDEFRGNESFEDAPRLRHHVTDKATYDMALDRLREADSPQFIFDLTMQNHSGYETGEIPEEMQLDVVYAGKSDPEVNEYLSCIQQSDEDLKYLIEELRTLDQKVIICFFGDHQPFLSKTLAGLEFGIEPADFTLKQAQTRYNVPYLIWKNYDDPDSVLNESNNANDSSEEGIVSSTETASASENTQPPKKMIGDTSLNFLGAILVQETGLPLNTKQKFILDTRPDIPVINLSGYRDRFGSWYWHYENSHLGELHRKYVYLQYNTLFDFD